MRILFISNYSELYGANRSLLTVADHFNRLPNYDVLMLVPSKGMIGAELERLGIRYLSIPYFSQLFYYKRQLKYFALPLLVIFTLLILPYIIFRVSVTKPDLIYSNTSAENIGIFVARILRKKHLTHVREFMDLDHGALFIGGNRMKRRFINWSDGVIFVSNAVREWINQGEPVSKRQTVIYNGVDVGCREPVQHLQSKDIHVGIVGILDEEKGQHMAIEYFREVRREYSNAILDIYGDKEGTYKERLKSMIREYDLQDCVVMHGFVKDSSVIYSNMDIMLMCSRCEGFGRVTVEAMQYGIPVLGYDKGGTSELIQNGRNGYLFMDKEGFMRGMSMILKDKEQYQRLSENAYYDGHELFSTEKYCQNVHDFVETL